MCMVHASNGLPHPIPPLVEDGGGFVCGGASALGVVELGVELELVTILVAQRVHLVRGVSEGLSAHVNEGTVLRVNGEEALEEPWSNTFLPGGSLLHVETDLRAKVLEVGCDQVAVDVGQQLILQLDVAVGCECSSEIWRGQDE